MFEVRQGFSDDPVATCETCEAPVSRVFHPVAVHFKGKGFYSTDYGSKKRARELKEAAEGTGKSDSKDDSKSNSSEKSSEKSTDSSKASKSDSSSASKAA
jgi:predicted nucleic acid-binding Zn ribbon protein